MATRLRFKETANGTLKTKMSSVTLGELTVNVDLETMIYDIWNEEHQCILQHSPKDNEKITKQKLLAAIKINLKELGVVFHGEIRNRNTVAERTKRNKGETK